MKFKVINRDSNYFNQVGKKYGQVTLDGIKLNLLEFIDGEYAGFTDDELQYISF
ncbi:hypothetical protein [Brevibacillus gelatini]|uniref:hypothetical protein n=1 Tax=Brevibacillus gelatini TaxID=1655277 RepID=UPI001475E091|nr:hypothetical protein [Brevibacillus gelatini]